MVELFKLIIAKPLHGVVATICVVLIVLQIEIFEISEANAVLQAQQEGDSLTSERVLVMMQTLTRIEINTQNSKETQELILDKQNRLFEEVFIKGK